MNKEEMQAKINALEERNYCLETIINSVHEGVLFTDEDCIIRVFNPAKAEMEFMDPKKVIGEISWNAYDHSNWEKSEHRQVFDEGTPILNAYRPHAYFNDVPMYIDYDTVPIIKDGKKLGVYTVCRTEAKVREMLFNLLEHKRKASAQGSNPSDMIAMSSGTRFTFNNIAGSSSVIREVIKEAQMISTMNMSILIVGETGVGKEVFAQSIHNLSRENNNFLAINCAAIPSELFESILFGTVKGAYTGAEETKGLFREAGNGTLFLDELNSLSIPNQNKLLRVLQEKRVRPVGSAEEYEVNCRLICATNEDVNVLLEEGRLRRDLYYRISEFTLEIPPLRERREDIIELAQMFIKQYNIELGRNISMISDDLEDWLISQDWKGNTRELQHAIQNMMLKTEPHYNVLTLKELPISYSRTEQRVKREREPDGEDFCVDWNEGLPENVRLFQKRMIEDAIKKADGNISVAAKLLKISRENLYGRMKRLEEI